jgi:hypothetical protein
MISPLSSPSFVMPRLGLGIHEFGWVRFDVCGAKLVDPKAKPWDDESV